MAIVRETKLPGVGVRHDFTTDDGIPIGVLVHRDGRRELLVYDRDDPDACTSVLHLTDQDTRTLAELLGAAQIAESLSAVQQQVEGLAIEWITIADDSRAAGETIGDGQYRTRTGTSIVAVIRSGTSIPAPGPDFAFEAGDTIVAVGTTDGLDRVRDILSS